MSKRCRDGYFAGAGVVLSSLLGLYSATHAQMGGGFAGGTGGVTTIPGTPFGGANDPSTVPATEGFRIVPSILLGERYDSNVFFVPPNTPGLKLEDFVTTVVPQIRGLYAGSLISFNATASAVGEYYVRNPSLNYVGANAGLLLDVSRLLDRWQSGTKMTVTERYIYTPQAPAFLTGNVDGAVGNPLVTGFQVGRVNVQRNFVSINGETPLSQVLSITAGYTNSFLKYGSSDVQQASPLFNLNAQSYSVGLAYDLTPLDKLNLKFIDSEFQYEPSSIGSFSTRGGTVGWSHEFSRTVSMYSNAGAQVIESTFQGVQSASILAPIGNFGVAWKDNETTMVLAYTLTNTPSLQFQGQVLLTQTVSFTVTQVTALPELLVLFNFNHARGDSYGPINGPSVSYASYGGTGGLVYKFTPVTFLGLTYSYSNFDNKFGGGNFAFDRNVVQLTMSQAF